MRWNADAWWEVHCLICQSQITRLHWNNTDFDWNWCAHFSCEVESYQASEADSQVYHSI